MVSAVVPLRQTVVELSLKQMAFDHLPQAALCLNASSQLLAANACAASLWRRSAADLVGRHLSELLDYPNTRIAARRWARLWQRLSIDVPLTLLAPVPLPDGRRALLQLQATLLQVEQERVALIVLRDIGPERSAQRRLRRELADARAMLEATAGATLLLGGDRRVLAAAGAAMLPELGRRDLIGLPFELLLGDESSAQFMAAAAGPRPEPPAQFRWQLRGPAGGTGAWLAATLAGSRSDRLVVHLRQVDAAQAARGPGLPTEAATPGMLAAQARRLAFRETLLDLAMQVREDFSESMAQLLRAMAQTLGVASASFWRLAADGASLRCEALFDRVGERLRRDWAGVQLRAADEELLFARLSQRQPIIVDDTRALASAERFRGESRWGQVRAVAEVPVLLNGGVIGVLAVYDARPRCWDDDETGFVSTAALLLALAIEAAQRQDAESRIEQLAWYDSLTGLPNRNLLRETMRDLVMTAANRHQRIAVMMIDLDRFKDVNDALGHVVGDALIKAVAKVLRETVGAAGTVARLGGDEFVVLVSEFRHRQEVALLAAQLARALHRTDFVPQVDTQVSASIGVALFPEHGREMSTLLKNADAAMFQAKRDGRNQFGFFNPIRHERAAREVQLGIQLLKALQADSAQFVVEYQPQVEMASGRVVGLEALIRWQHPTYGLLMPDRFVGVAELSGLSGRITRWVISEVCTQILRWRQALPGFDIPVAVNVAGREMGSAGLPMMLRDALQKFGIEPSMLVLEITERTLVRDGEINNDVMSELVALGVRLVLDDFGTGYSMFGYLKRMPIQALKIDQSFVSGVPEDADSRAIVNAMVALARQFRLKIVVEGVETPEQVAYLRSIGCEYAQGFYYARPLSPQMVLAHVRRNGD